MYAIKHPFHIHSIVPFRIILQSHVTILTSVVKSFNYSAGQETLSFYGKRRFIILLRSPPLDPIMSHLNPISLKYILII
jgi:hypothetical protein